MRKKGINLAQTGIASTKRDATSRSPSHFFTIKHLHASSHSNSSFFVSSLPPLMLSQVLRASSNTRGANGCWWKNCPILGVSRSFFEGGRAPGGRPRLPDMLVQLPFDPSPQKEITKRRKVLSLGGTKLKFATGPRLAHDHGENRAQKEDLMAEPENRPPSLQT